MEKSVDIRDDMYNSEQRLRFMTRCAGNCRRVACAPPANVPFTKCHTR